MRPVRIILYDIIPFSHVSGVLPIFMAPAISLIGDVAHFLAAVYASPCTPSLPYAYLFF